MSGPAPPKEAIATLATHGDEAKLLAGGHSLIPLMRFRLARPAVVVDIGRLDDLSYIRDGGDHVAIGALTRHRDVETSDLVAARAGLLGDVTSHVGDPQVRHRGTLGGAVAHGDPASDIPSALIALGATLVATGPQGSREISVDDFFSGFLETALADDEMLTEVRIPAADGAPLGFREVQPPCSGLGDRGSVSGRARRWRRRRRPGEHGLDAHPGRRRRERGGGRGFAGRGGRTGRRGL